MRPIAINTIIQWLPVADEKCLGERVLWIDPAGVDVVLMPLFRERTKKRKCDQANPQEKQTVKAPSLPIWRKMQEIEMALATEAAIRRPSDPFALIRCPQEDFIEKYRSQMDENWALIEPLANQEPYIYDSVERGRLIGKVVVSEKALKKIIYKLLKRYWAAGKSKYALLPQFNLCGAPGESRLIDKEDLKTSIEELPKRGRPSNVLLVEPDHRGVNITVDDRKIFDIVIKTHYDKREQNPLKLAYNEMVKRYYSQGVVTEFGISSSQTLPEHLRPTLEQFEYHTRKARRAISSIIARQGMKNFKLNKRALLGNSTQMAFGPGSIFQIDATVGDIYLVSSLDRTVIIGRPVIYMVMDVFSRMVVGLYVGLDGPSWIGAMMALANATTDKVAFCAEYGIPIDDNVWPCCNLPQAVLADRGELIGYKSDVLVSGLNIPVANCSPYRADWKGIVEQSFRLLNNKSIKWVPGAVRKREVGEKDHRLDAILTLWELTKLLTYTVLFHNQHHWIDDYPADKDLIRDHVKPIPLDLWEWGIENRVGLLREESPDIIKLNLLPRETATVTGSGLMFKKLHYSNDRLVQEQWFEQARANGEDAKVPIAYDPRKPRTIYLLSQDYRVIEPCQLLERDERFGNLQLDEIIDYYATEGTRSTLHKGRETQSDVVLSTAREQVVEVAQRATNEANSCKKSNRERTGNIKANRDAEKIRNREHEGFDLTPNGSQLRPASVSGNNDGTTEFQEEVPETALQKDQKMLELIKQTTRGNS